ncbi:hypothetical protein CNEO2_570003 [Clostridium neonatale]|uniref:AAA family ATPase n=1 Tax=Clostridium neonatale TaxID=137838 RepID=UPI00291B9586|nr:AAA family ATPase [Clostridium neonatale]CAI3244078.1 hypothetical protein CNEO2_570003 [Clostridium neonatale]CAI3539520.1 hypothetical protein CNEO4_170004 [Clostridium neonatale]
MKEIFIKQVIELIQVYLEPTEEENNLYYSINNINEFIECLDKIFNYWENQIKKESEKSFTTDFVENNFSNFAKNLAMRIIHCKDEFFKASPKDITNLFMHRHLGYGFYKAYNELSESNNENEKYSEFNYFLSNDKKYAKILYCSMLEYFKNFYGRFRDNELAIEMICKYYTYGENLDEQNEQTLISALYNHCTMAGDLGDSGYAFNGINLIKKYLNIISPEIVEKVIEYYSYYDVINFPIYRKQIYTMIQSSNFDEKTKFKLKFFYIDCILLMNQLTRIFYKLYKDKFGLIYSSIEKKHIGENNVINFELKENEQKKYIWIKSQDKSGMILDQDGDKILEVHFSNENIKMKMLTLEYKFSIANNKNDYMLNEYVSNTFYEKLEEKFKMDINEKHRDKQFIFSHIWINNYHGIKNQQLSFDNSFRISYINDKLEIKKNNEDDILTKNFFGDNIYSISAIVGKNGVGKTSIINFLKDIFFGILHELDEGRISSKNGIILKNRYIKEKEEFLVIFYIDNQPYIMTNYKNFYFYDEKIPMYEGEALKKNSENSKLIYFSNMIDPDVTKMKPLVVNNEGKVLRKVMSRILFIDYSENKTYKENTNEYNKYYDSLGKDNEQYINKDFWYKICFLDKYRDLSKFLGDNFSINNLKCETYNDKLEHELNEILSKSNNSLIDEILKLGKDKLTSSVIKLKNFSAGQYAKFSFLSKLFWCLDGYYEYHEKIEKVIGNYIFYIGDAILNDGTAVIFIDEGETFYHPEWQQQYVNTLLKFINKYTTNKNIKIQIILTSNSPFIISDIPTSNILFLPEIKKNDIQTFGANIYDLCRNGFFLNNNSYGVLGEFATEKIDEVENILIKLSKEIKLIDKESEKEARKLFEDIDGIDREKIVYEKSKIIRNKKINDIREKNIEKLNECKKIIDIIGEDVIRKTLLEQYNQIIRIIDINRKEDNKELKELKNKFQKLSKNDQNELIKFIIHERDNE